MPDDAASARDRPEPLISYRAMFDAEVAEATAELERSWRGLIASGIIAGACVGTSILLLGMVLSPFEQIPEQPAFRLLIGMIYAIGFILAILGRGDLFTEYTTIAIFPVLTGASGLGALLRLWVLVYAGNLIGGSVLALFAVGLTPALGVADAAAFGAYAQHLAAPGGLVILASATLAGWLMGLLSWLIVGGRDTTSQFLFILVVGVTIGALGLHHSVTGAIGMIAGVMADPRIAWPDVLHVLWWTAAGNAVGAVVFAALVTLGVRNHRHRTEPPRGR